MSSKRNQKRSQNRSKDYQKLEPRHLLAALSEPFADNAVTVEQMIERAQQVPFMTGEVVVALRADVAAAQAPAVVDSIDWTELAGIDATPIRRLMSIDGNVGESVSLVHLDIGDADLFHVMRTLDQSDTVMWSAPNFVHVGDFREFIPNDPDYVNQYHHPLMRNDHAWDIEMGDANIVIGVTDDGVELGHEDLAANIWTNPNEIPGNGIDDDSNGYVDDVNGWDFAGGDNNPDSDGGDHGTHVAGIAAAVTDNGIGIAGVAGSATIMPLKFTFGSNPWTSALINETLAYGVDNGSQIINTSYRIDQFWGDPTFEAGLQYVHDNNALHFNSAGNGFSINTARQNFDQTILVANTDSNDQRNISSNIGYGVDISSPGTQILSTITGGGYANFTGTSMAAPDAAGVAALIWSHNPGWTNVQVAAQLMATADFIDHLNPGIEGTLGSGRTNAFRALTETLPAPQIQEIAELPAAGTWANNTSINSFSIRFDQVMDLATANTSSNYRLISAGNDGLFDTADDTVIPLSHEQYMIGTNVFEFQLPGGNLDYGQYRFTISNLTNPFGTGLDGNGDGFEGDTYVHDFRITRPGMAIVNVDQQYYQTEDTVLIQLMDDNLAGANPVVTVTSNAGDNEQVVLTQVGLNQWTGQILTQPGLGFPGDNFLNVFEGDVITVHYLDTNDGLGNPFASSVDAMIVNQLSVDNPTTQPIDDTGTIVSTIEVSDSGSLGDLNVMIDVSHGRTSDLSAVLVSPNGTRINLFANVGTDAGENFTGTIFDNEAAVSINEGGAPFRGRYQPVGDLSALQGIPIQGTWQLEVTDEVSGVTGTLNDWGLQIQLLGGLVGTPGDDVIVVDMRTETIQVTINGVTTDVSAETAALTIDALAGNDTLTVYTNSSDTSVTIRDYLVSLTSSFNLSTSSIENARILGQGGFNRARIFGSNVDDFFRNFATGSELTSDFYDYSVLGFHEVSAFSFGGNDEALLIDTPGNDRYYGTETYSRLTSSDGFVHIRDFDDVRVRANQGGFDIAQFVGGEGDDNFWANTEFATFDTPTDRQVARNFERTWARGGFGNDTARLIGSPGNDRLISHPGNTFMRGNGFLNQVLDFDNIVALGGAGLNKAFLHDTHGDDTFYSTPVFSTLQSETMSRYVREFQEVTAHGSAGFDRATFVDSAGDDRYIARPDYAYLIGPGFFNQARTFNSVTARSTTGNDIAIIYASSEDARFFGTQGRVLLDGPTYFNQALNFGNVTARLTGSGYQHAVLEDSAGNDTLIANGNLATLFNNQYRIQVFGVDRVFARSIHGGVDQLFATENLQYDLEVFGNWGVG